MEQEQADGEVYAICPICVQEMCPGYGCTKETIIDKDGYMYRRIKAGDARDMLPDMKEGQFCHDCNVTKGQYHHLGCDMETCPVCRDQLFICGCCDGVPR